MSDNEEYYDGEDGEEMDQDEEYAWNGSDGEDDGDENYSSSSLSASARVGLKFEGKLLDHLNIPSKNVAYSVYRQLSEICLVDISDTNFYSAMLTAQVKDQFVIANIHFPTAEPFFPQAPPVITLQSHFKKPNDRFNIIFNCHPSLLNSRWNLCTNIYEIVKDMIEVAKVSIVEMIDEDPNSTTERIINLIKSNDIDISGLFPDNAFTNLPSFGIVKENVAAGSGKGPSRGTGYSSGGVIAKWNFANHNLMKIENLKTLLKTFEKLDKVDIWVTDTVYYILNNVVSPTITLDEFFRNFEYYSIVISAVASLPNPSPHILPSVGLMRLYEDILKSKIRNTLEANETAVVDKLELIYQRFTTRDGVINYSSAGSGSTPNKTNNSTNNNTNSSSTNTNNSSTNSSSSNSSNMVVSTPPGSASSKKRLLSASLGTSKSEPIILDNIADSTTTTAVDGGTGENIVTGVSGQDTSGMSGGEKDTENNGNMVAPVASLASTRDRVVELEEPFKEHIFMGDMKSTERLPAKWFRRLRIELTTMPESLPNNVIVFTGINCSQPNLMKILMFPESADTPYCGGCFEFDVFIPSDYPATSPKCKLVTTGYGTVRFNPNLYACGKVCLSLLGTWSGEAWNPEISSLTQVINSILFLIFIENPYFNEPGYQSSENTPTGMAASNAYNQVIRTGTLEYAYLDHFTKATGRQLTPWIVPGAIETWKAKGRGTALKWATEGTAAQNQHMTNTIEKIDAAVASLAGVDFSTTETTTATLPAAPAKKGWFGTSK